MKTQVFNIASIDLSAYNFSQDFYRKQSLIRLSSLSDLVLASNKQTNFI